jgi:hypothetical protein
VSVSQEGGQQDAGGQDAWLDMSRYPDTDPDTVLSSDEHSLLTTSLAVDDAELPDAVWEHMLAVVAGDAEPADDDPTDDASTEPADDGDAWTDDVVTDEARDTHDPGVDDPGTAEPDVHHDDGGWV